MTYVPANASEDVLRYLAVGRQLGYGGYLTLDILTYVFPPNPLLVGTVGLTWLG